MTSATQSNSGCSAYIGFLYALLGNPDVITSESLQTHGLSEQITQLLSGVDRSSGSSDWLKDLFLTGGYDAMVNYECLIISTNQELEAQGEETLYAVYPYDGLSIADSPLGYVDNGDAREGTGLSGFTGVSPVRDEVQNEIQRTGRRTGYEGVSAGERRRVPRPTGASSRIGCSLLFGCPPPMCSWSVWICTRRSSASPPSRSTVWTTPAAWRG